MSKQKNKNNKIYFTEEQIAAMRKEARETENGDYFEIYRRETEKLVGTLNIENLNQFLLSSMDNSDTFDMEEFERRNKEFDRKYPTDADKKRAFKLARRGYNVF